MPGQESQDILFVDGYNVIHDWPELRSYLSVSLHASRERLIDILSEYRSVTGQKIILVFDAHHTERLAKDVEARHGVEVVFTHKGITADSYIERAVHSLDPRKAGVIRVATSDMQEQHVVLGDGAVRVSARELGEMVSDALHTAKEVHIAARPVKPNTLENKLPPEIVKKLRTLAQNLYKK
ncbi:MAG: NYN domain-containing protein [Christensenellales bacterium]